MTPKTNRKLTLGFAALLCGLLAPSALGASGDLQTFQLKLHQGVNTLTVDPTRTVDPSKPYFNMLDIGECTYLGRYVNNGWVQIDMSAQPPRSLGGEGTLTAANGDSVGWVIAVDPANPEKVYIVPNTGTGRFEGATGYIDNFPISMTPNPYGLTIVHWAKGELTVPKKTPFKISGQICFLPFSDVGVATHFGRFVSVDEGSGGATGKYFTANGDQVNWEAGGMTSYDPITHIFTGINYLRGGTGRFEGATGEYSYTAIPVPGAFLTFDYEGEGFIAY